MGIELTRHDRFLSWYNTIREATSWNLLPREESFTFSAYDSPSHPHNTFSISNCISLSCLVWTKLSEQRAGNRKSVVNFTP
jgi:hypothetical protein